MKRETLPREPIQASKQPMQHLVHKERLLRCMLVKNIDRGIECQRG